MYWENCPESRLIFSRDLKPTARKEHKCCECGRTIKVGEKYSYFVGGWNDDYYYHYGNYFGTYKTCLECEKDWDEIIKIHHENGEDEACCIFGLLREAVQEAFDEGFLNESDRLVQKWLDVDISELSPEEGEGHERQEAVAQMRVYSHQLI